MQQSDSTNPIKTPIGDEAHGLPTPPTSDGFNVPLETQIDMPAYVKAVWRRKWMVMMIAALCFIGAVVYLMQATPLYQVTMQIRPGITDYDRDTPRRGWKNTDLQNWIEKTLAPSFLSENRKKGQKIGRIGVQTTRSDQTVGVFLLTSNPEQGKMVLDEFFLFLTSPDTERRLDLGIVLSRDEIDEDIRDLSNQLKTVEVVESKELQGSITEQQREMRLQEEVIGLLNQERYVNQSTIEQLQRQADIMQKNMEQPATIHEGGAEKNQNKDLTASVKSSSLQENTYYLFQLYDRISLLRKAVIDIELEKVKAQALIDGCKEKIGLLRLKLDNDIPQKKDNITRHIISLNQKMSALKTAERVSPPVASKKPVRPKRDLTMAVAALLGIFLGSALALMLERHAAKN